MERARVSFHKFRRSRKQVCSVVTPIMAPPQERDERHPGGEVFAVIAVVLIVLAFGPG